MMPRTNIVFVIIFDGFLTDRKGKIWDTENDMRKNHSVENQCVENHSAKKKEKERRT